MQIILLIIAVSIDVFLACAACGMEHIKIGNKAALCISGICSGVLLFALLFGKYLDGMIPETYTARLCFAVFFLVGVWKLSEYAVKRYFRKRPFHGKKQHVILDIYNNPASADRDHSANMSAAEAVCFALAMSVDGLFGGISAGLSDMNFCVTSACSLLVSFLAVRAGCAAGRQAAKIWDCDFSWVSGAIFFVLAFSRLL